MLALINDVHNSIGLPGAGPLLPDLAAKPAAAGTGPAWGGRGAKPSGLGLEYRVWIGTGVRTVNRLSERVGVAEILGHNGRARQALDPLIPVTRSDSRGAARKDHSRGPTDIVGVLNRRHEYVAGGL